MPGYLFHTNLVFNFSTAINVLFFPNKKIHVQCTKESINGFTQRVKDELKIETVS